jgi:hypothetical protein
MLPFDEKTLYRAVAGSTVDALTDQDFESNAVRLVKRYWPDEDAADYFAISSYDSQEQALENAQIHDRPRKRGEEPRWRGIARFHVDGHQGHVFAATYESGHFSAWGEPSAFRSTTDWVFPIED